MAASVALMCLALAGMLALAGCGTAQTGGTSSETTATVGANMAGPAQKVVISQATVDARPQPWALTTPESAVRSYLDWISYAYRIATSDVATPTMGADEGVRVDSYIQYNLEQSRLIDQTLGSITFGTASKTATATLLPATEKWSYRYVSISTADKTLSGPFTASYDTTYTLTKTAKGWIVQSVAAKAIGTVK